nr:phosphatase PAP2 family protein [Frigoribacterium sp. CFBP 13712]
MLFHWSVSAYPTVSAPPAVRRPGATRWAVTSGVAAVALVGVYIAAVLTPAGQRVEDSILASVDGNTLLQSGVALDAISPTAVLAILVLTVGVSLLRRRPGAAIQSAGLIIGATVTSQLLKQFVPRPDLTGELYSNSFPSGHATIAVAGLLAVMTAFGRHLRPLLFVVGTAFAAIVAEQTVAYGWHRCSDVVGSCAVALLWLGIVRFAATRWSRAATTVDQVGAKSHAVTSSIIGLAVVVCLATSGAVWGIGIGSDMSLSGSTGYGVLDGARLAAAGVVLVTAWIAWKLDRRA